MKKIFIIAITIIASFFIAGFSTETPTIKIGTMAGPETSLVELAKNIAKTKYNLNVQIVQFTDYIQPNSALEDGSIDINMFQHLPFLEQENITRGYHIVAIAKTFIFPMAIYSEKHKNLIDIADGARISISNDPTNEARALLLLQSAGLIAIKKSAGYSATLKDITTNPHHLNFIELDGPQLPRSLEDVDYAVINNTFAYGAGLNLKTEKIYTEKTTSPFANVIAVKSGREHDANLLKLVKALQSEEVNEKAKLLFDQSAIKAW